MKKRKSFYWIAGALLVLIVTLNMQSIKNAGADVMLSLFKWRMHNTSSPTFRSAEVDSLYNKKTYRYFLFVRDLPIQKEAVLSALQDSVLIIKSKNLHDWNVGLDCDTVSLAESLFDYVIEGEDNSSLYMVKSVRQDMPNSYEMSKM